MEEETTQNFEEEKQAPYFEEEEITAQDTAEDFINFVVLGHDNFTEHSYWFSDAILNTDPELKVLKAELAKFNLKLVKNGDCWKIELI